MIILVVNLEWDGSDVMGQHWRGCVAANYIESGAASKNNARHYLYISSHSRFRSPKRSHLQLAQSIIYLQQCTSRPKDMSPGVQTLTPTVVTPNQGLSNASAMPFSPNNFPDDGLILLLRQNSVSKGWYYKPKQVFPAYLMYLPRHFAISNHIRVYGSRTDDSRRH